MIEVRDNAGYEWAVVEHTGREGDGCLPLVYLCRDDDRAEVGDARVTQAELIEWARTILDVIDPERAR